MVVAQFLRTLTAIFKTTRLAFCSLESCTVSSFRSPDDGTKKGNLRTTHKLSTYYRIEGPRKDASQNFNNSSLDTSAFRVVGPYRTADFK